MNTKILIGILCIHDLPIDDYESNDGILFLHNERKPLGQLIKDFAKYDKVAISYFVSDTEQTETEAIESLMKSLYGLPSADISSSSHPYSEITPDLCWSHYNEFKIGGHDMNRELSSFTGSNPLTCYASQNDTRLPIRSPICGAGDCRNDPTWRGRRRHAPQQRPYWNIPLGVRIAGMD